MADEPTLGDDAPLQMSMEVVATNGGGGDCMIRFYAKLDYEWVEQFDRLRSLGYPAVEAAGLATVTCGHRYGG